MTKPKSKLIQARWGQMKVLNYYGHRDLDQMNWMPNKNLDDELTCD